MSGRSVQINLRINFPMILFIVLVIHALFLVAKKVNFNQIVTEAPIERRPLKIQDIRDSIKTVGARDSDTRDSVYLAKNEKKSQKITKDKPSKVKNESKTLSLSDLNSAHRSVDNAQPNLRPGSRPELKKPMALAGLGFKGKEIKQFANGSLSGAPSSGDLAAPGLSNTDVAVNLEVPEGVSPDELNKYELMFYGFQRRTAINYVNSFYKNLDKFQQANPHLTFPLTETKQVMTGRLTYDQKGNIKQIKMIRWSNLQRLQDFFLEVLKDMDTLHNPPQALWEKTGEFSIYFSFVVNG